MNVKVFSAVRYFLVAVFFLTLGISSIYAEFEKKVVNYNGLVNANGSKIQINFIGAQTQLNLYPEPQFNNSLMNTHIIVKNAKIGKGVVIYIYVIKEDGGEIITKIETNKGLDEFWINSSGESIYVVENFCDRIRKFYCYLGNYNDTVRNYMDKSSCPEFLIFGGYGNDILEGGPNNDLIKGSWGEDILIGRKGNDKLDGEYDPDVLLGGDGNDYLTGSETESWYATGIPSANSGYDILIGGKGDDTLYGTSPLSSGWGGKGGDYEILIGGEGKDYLDGKGGLDVLYGGPEIDELLNGDTLVDEDNDDKVIVDISDEFK